MRFYHALECGRIPVLIKSGNKLPFDKHIDYEKYIVLANNEKDMIKKIMHTWENEDIIQRQKDCAKLYQDWFAPMSFEEKTILYIQEYIHD
jgi:hypothetical protein